MADLNVRYGSVTFESDEPVTIRGVSNLAKAAKIAGIPADAVITSMSFQWNSRVHITINWNRAG